MLPSNLRVPHKYYNIVLMRYIITRYITRSLTYYVSDLVILICASIMT